VAKEAVSAGVDIINDITALRHSPRMVSLICKYKLGCILMHMKGNPRTMQLKPATYKNVVEDVFEFLSERINYCVDKGIDREQLMIDPGIGFGKDVDANISILNKLYVFRQFGVPLFLGLSRKSFIGHILHANIEQRLIGTISASVLSFIKGADVFRVHDVKETRQALKVAYRIMEPCRIS
jgi:dihydropteroate synthase